MIQFYKTIHNTVVEIDRMESGCWVCVIAPTPDEITTLVDEYKLDSGFIYSSLDEEESARVELEDDQTLIIVDSPTVEKQTENTIQYVTTPMGIILKSNCVFTISYKENLVLSEFSSGLIRNVQTHLKTQFVLNLLLRIASKFLQCLKQIEKISSSLEKNLSKSMKNKELVQLLGLEKSLVYFSTSLKANETILEKILRGRVIRLYEEDQDLLEDVLIEVKQAVEMSTIYSSILRGMMDAYGSIISNNVNYVMQRLTIVTIIIAIPNIVFSFYGMNVADLPGARTLIALAVAVFITLAAAGFLLMKNK